MKNTTIGILALQGNYHAHSQCLEKLGIQWCFINKPSQISQVDGLIIPGGESGVLLKHFDYNPDWILRINQFFKDNKPILGTCAGIILLAKDVSPKQFSFGFLDIRVIRNAYGRQLQSSNDLVSFAVKDHNNQQVNTTDTIVSFIRAPKIDKVLSDKLEIIAKRSKEVVGVRQGNVFGLTCHPEYTTTLIHKLFNESIESVRSIT